MPDLEIEVATNEFAEVVLSTNPLVDLEVSIDSVVLVGGIPDNETVEVTIAGPVMIGPGAVQDYGSAPGLIVLNPGQSVPGGTPSGTIVLRKQ